MSVPIEDYEIKAMRHKISKDDVIMVLSYTGDNKSVLRGLDVLAVATPTIVSFTRADNNVIQNMSDLNFYIFADQMSFLKEMISPVAVG